MDTSIAVAVERELWDLLRPFYRDPQVAFKEVAVLELYRRRQISSGKAAELLGMGRFEFVRHAGRLGIPFFDLDERDVTEELRQASNNS
jgi:predicted HTH domain antitoxin